MTSLTGEEYSADDNELNKKFDECANYMRIHITSEERNFLQFVWLHFVYDPQLMRDGRGQLPVTGKFETLTSRIGDITLGMRRVDPKKENKKYEELVRTQNTLFAARDLIHVMEYPIIDPHDSQLEASRAIKASNSEGVHPERVRLYHKFLLNFTELEPRRKRFNTVLEDLTRSMRGAVLNKAREYIDVLVGQISDWRESDESGRYIPVVEDDAFASLLLTTRQDAVDDTLRRAENYLTRGKRDRGGRCLGRAKSLSTFDPLKNLDDTLSVTIKGRPQYAGEVKDRIMDLASRFSASRHS